MTGFDLFDVQRLSLSETMPPSLPAEHVAARDRLWDAAVRANPGALFDGPVVACADMAWSGPGTLRLRWARVTYRHYALRRVPGAVALGSLFVNVVQPTDDGRLVVARMSPATAAPGRWQLPGGSVEPPEGDSGLDEDALVVQAARELAEEMGVAVAPRALRLWAVTRGENRSVGLTYLAPPLQETVLRKAFGEVARIERAQGREPELAELAMVRSTDDLTGLSGPRADYLEPIVARYTQDPVHS
ncbi:8-oxo-dGTP pyrophosphatase MutT (NUDIX family) [Streptomyces aurantiacus]|uniref:NUDIX hydrolase n=1 Tax=Streptomyces aurantiacus TaxID=47760 RepID=UPI00278F51CB|nr:NUDIX domain-containing protein [Streptomyces aurantiacus]MDQ0771588.1 8-oxo-dGTP pyrophosphatase MutT (NUDIX family) [Streptomyces aurantiacus]